MKLGEDMPAITHSAVHGEVEISKGCGRNCQFCTPTVQRKTDVPLDVILKEGGSNKIGAIKAVRQLKPELGLGEAKQFVESAPQKVLEAANKEDAENAKKVLEEAGCVVEMK